MSATKTIKIGVKDILYTTSLVSRSFISTKFSLFELRRTFVQGVFYDAMKVFMKGCWHRDGLINTNKIGWLIGTREYTVHTKYWCYVEKLIFLDKLLGYERFIRYTETWRGTIGEVWPQCKFFWAQHNQYILGSRFKPQQK